MNAHYALIPATAFVQRIPAAAAVAGISVLNSKIEPSKVNEYMSE